MESIDDIRRKIGVSINLYNTRPVEDFEGLSPAEMRYILYDPFSKDSPLQFQKNIPSGILAQIPFLNQVVYLLQKINDNDGIKLTSTGSLPTTMVKDIYSQGFIKDPIIEAGITKLYAETSCLPIHLTRIITQLSGFINKKHNKINLTKTWKNKITTHNNQEILEQIFQTFCQKFNWSYNDGYSSRQTGQIGFAFSLFLLSRYGDIERPDRFYSEKYLKAFPMIRQDFSDNPFDEDDRQFHHAYSLRTFERFLEYFNVTQSRTEGEFLEGIKFIKKTVLFDKILCFED